MRYTISILFRTFVAIKKPYGTMRNIELLSKTCFFEITTVLNDFALLDDIQRLENIKGEKPPLLPHEACLRNVRTIMMGIISSLSYMHLAIMQIKKRYNTKYYSANGYTAYDFYRYHYSSFCHSIATIHDLYFKMVVELCDLNIDSKKMIQWKKMRNELNANEENDIKGLLELFFSIIEEHEKKRNKVSHEGLLFTKMLDNYHLTNIWTNTYGKSMTENNRLEYTTGTTENKYLLSKTKKSFMNELNKVTDAAVDCTEKLFELLLPKLLHKMNTDFLESHRTEFVELNLESLNKYVLA